MKPYLNWLRKAIDRVDSHLKLLSHEQGYVEQVFDTAGDIAEEAGQRALKVGLAELYTDSMGLAGASDPEVVLIFLAKCVDAALAKLPHEDEPAHGPFTVAQAAKRLGVSPGTVYALNESGKLRGQRIGKGRGTIRITQEELQAFQRDASGTPALASNSARRQRHLGML